MNKLMIYSLLLLIYLTLSKSLSPSELGINYVNTSKDLSKLINGAPVSAILIDAHTTGFLIKTYYLKYKVVYGFQSYEELVVRTSSSFFKKYSDHIGLATFRRYKSDNTISSTPLPPGSVFVGDSNFGQWKRDEKKNKYWKFSRVYRQLPIYLGWDDYKMSEQDYELVRMSMNQEQAFMGLKEYFGMTGKLTLKNFPHFFERKNKYIMTWKDFLKNYFKENFINYKEKL